MSIREKNSNRNLHTNLEMEYASDYVYEFDMADLRDGTDEFMIDLLDDLHVPRKDLMMHLSNFDYSLNSPLIDDEINSFTDWARGKPVDSRWNTNKWLTFKTFLKKQMDTRTLKYADTFSKWFGEFNQKESFKECNQFTEILKKAQTCSKITRPVIDAFLRGWLAQQIHWKSLSHIDLPKYCLKWGHYFWELHLVSLLLNCTTNSEASYLVKTTASTQLSEPNNPYHFMLPTKNFGVLLIGSGLVCLLDHCRVVDRNTILMMKDTYIARFNTFLSTSNRVDSIFPSDITHKMRDLYEMGDRVLQEGGTSGYKSIKLIEPICNNRLTQVAQSFRPLIPTFPEFNNHVVNAVKEASELTPSISELFDLVNSEDNIEIILTIYGSFRHWGHPFIDYFEGLRSLHKQVTMDKTIDTAYANYLASDLSFLVIRNQFKTKKCWPVDHRLMEEGNPLHRFVKNNTWPNNSIITNFGPHWHELPLTKCFDIPDVIDPSIIYADKSHSLTRSEIREFLGRNPRSPIPSHKLLSSLLKNPGTNWPKFLKKVNDHGLDPDQLVIGLKPKERELKIGGRFFSLMSWEMRDYFVMTEYLIKTHFVPLFDGLTMADDLTTVVGKMLKNSDGQGEIDYSHVTTADHIDYEKWNNHQRGEANNPTFTVMGQFLGYPKLIARTHEIFEKSWIYYNARGDLMEINAAGDLVNKTEQMVCWLGQKGGLEGLRQKGWSIVNLLVIKRESLSVNTNVKVLAQGDNQVICSMYKLRPSRNPQQLQTNLADVCHNNRVLMRRIACGTSSLGLIINHDETMKSTEFLNYGKHCVIRGNLRNLETKRWSRVTCVTNDQLPTMANVLSTTSSNALTVSHFSDSPLNSMVLYNFYGHFVRIICETHNPALRGPVAEILGIPHDELMSLRYLVGSLYLDPSIGGVCGMSLSRFLIRVFPDPITESLSFLKLIHDNTADEELKKLMIVYGNPVLRVEHDPDIMKLLEDPLSLNIPRGIDANTMIKERIRKSLVESVSDIGNEVISQAVTHQASYEHVFQAHLRSITPLFPRFLSEYRAATYLGIVDSIIGLFQNSKTIRNQFRGSLDKQYDALIVDSEVYSIKLLLGKLKRPHSVDSMWKCSASHADLLRELSWGQKVYGATVPHPLEMLDIPLRNLGTCKACDQGFPQYLNLSVLIPVGFQELKTRKGTCAAYLGSSTMESTSILQHWERETKMPLLRRAASLRNAIGWFITPESNLAESILGNLKALTGEDWSENIRGFKRTGSALHRFSCSRQSNGGYTAQNPSKLTRMISTTNAFSNLGDQNYDFMYQSCLLYSLMSVGEVHSPTAGQGFYHVHMKCSDCLRQIEEISLNCPTPYIHVDISSDLALWKPEGSEWSTHVPIVEIPLRTWDILSPDEKSYHIGVIQGFLFGDSTWGSTRASSDPALFPLTIAKKVLPSSYMDGILTGILRSSIVSITHQRLIEKPQKYRELVIGHASMTISEMKTNPNILNIWREEEFQKLFASVSHKISPSYPMIEVDVGYSGTNYLSYLLIEKGHRFLTQKHDQKDTNIWVFTDTYRFEVVALLGISEACWEVLSSKYLTKTTKMKLNSLRVLGSQIRNIAEHQQLDIGILNRLLTSLVYTDREVRHAVKGLDTVSTDQNLSPQEWGREYRGLCKSVMVEYGPDPSPIVVPNLNSLRFQNPLISGLRTAQLATGSHYKLRAILDYLNISPRGAICGGDGSGGVSALVLRTYPSCRVIFNSLCHYDQVRLKGNSPSPPSAIVHASRYPENCVNHKTNWNNSNDLSKEETWLYFRYLCKAHCMTIDLIILDMEVTDEATIAKIEALTITWMPGLGSDSCILIFKTYLTRLFGSKTNLLTELKGRYSRVEVVTTSVSSSQTSEVYLIISGLIKGAHLRVSHPDFRRLKVDTESFPLFRRPIQEFIRALRLYDVNMDQGVPSSLITDPICDLIVLLQQLGIRSDLCHIYAREFGGQTRRLTLPMSLFILCVSGIISITTGYKSRPGPPSDGVIVRLSCWVTGFIIWMGYRLKNFNISHLGQTLIDKYVPFGFEAKKRGKFFYSTFSLVQNLSHFKAIQLDSEMATIGFVIRVLQRNYPRSCEFPQIEYLDEELKRYNSALTYQSFDQSTHLIGLIGNRMGLNVGTAIPRISLLEDGGGSRHCIESSYRD